MIAAETERAISITPSLDFDLVRKHIFTVEAEKSRLVKISELWIKS